MAFRRIILCADDYGLSPAVSRGIRLLLDMERLSAVSCMVVYPEFDTDGPLLKPWLGRADIGLHFTLTASRPLGDVMRSAYLGKLDSGAVAEELECQLAKFTTIMGRPPDYIDGHQHVHLLPGVRDAVVGAAARIGAYVRSTREPIGPAMAMRPSPVEAAFLSWTGSALQALLGKRGLKSNSGFRGVRTFREAAPYRTLFRRMIAGAGRGSLVMCHPGYADAILTARDGIGAPREAEMHYFASEDFPRDLTEAGLALARFDATAETRINARPACRS